MMYYTEKDWPFSRKPRTVQLEALSRSLFGVSAYTPKGLREDGPVEIKTEHSMPSRGWGHYLEMRLGKTDVALAEMVYLYVHYDVRRFVVIAPSKFTSDWEVVANGHGMPFPAQRIRAKHLTKKGADALPKHGLVCINHEMVYNKKNVAILDRWLSEEKSMVVVDESVILANFNSTSSRSMHDLGKSANFTRVLSGKPQVKGPADMYGQLRFTKALNGVVSNTFNHRYCKYGGFQGKQIIDVIEENQAELTAIINTVGFVATKLDWAGIGDPDVFDRRVPMSAGQIAAYRQMEKDYYLEFGDSEISPANVAGAMAKLNQVTCGFMYDDDKNVHWITPLHETARFKEVMAIIGEELPKNEKVIIVATHSPVIDALLAHTSQFSPAVIRGNQKPEITMAEKERFNTDPSCKIMIGQVKSLKYGHDLRSTREYPCLTTIMFEGTFSLDDYSQVIERNRGVEQYGQTQVVCMVSSARDTAMTNSLARKEDWFRSVVKDKFRPTIFYDGDD